MIRRRGLIGGLIGLIAAPAVVRAESLMRVSAPRMVTGLTVDNWRRYVRLCDIPLYGRSPAQDIIDLLMQQNEIMHDLVWKTPTFGVRGARISGAEELRRFRVLVAAAV